MDDYCIPAHPDHHCDGNGREDFDHRVIDRVRHDRVLERVHVLLVYLLKPLVGLLLAVEQLQDDDPGDVLLHGSVDLGNRHADAAITVADPVAEDFRTDEDKRKDGEGDQGQLPVHVEHDAENAGEHKNVFEDRDDAGGKHFVQRIDVGGGACDETTDRILVEECDMHALQVAEDFGAEIEHRLLSRPLHVIRL